MYDNVRQRTAKIWNWYEVKLSMDFIMTPTIRFQEKVGEQVTMFFCGPSGNTLVFKSFKDMGQLFAS